MKCYVIIRHTSEKHVSPSNHATGFPLSYYAGRYQLSAGREPSKCCCHKVCRSSLSYFRTDTKCPSCPPNRRNTARPSISNATELLQNAIPVPDTQEETQEGLTGRKKRILSLDGGGIRGISTLLILQNIMECIREIGGYSEPLRPCEFFDLIGGTSTGG